MPDLIKAIETVFPRKTVVIVGDLIADQFLSGTISRVSREAPVFIMRHDETVTLPGAAANAAANAASLGGRAVLIGVVGKDENGRKLMTAIADASVDASGVILDADTTTTTKVRVLAGRDFAARNQVIRIDYEGRRSLSTQAHETLRKNLADAAQHADVIVISDYNYGAVTPEIFTDAVGLAQDRGIPIVVDSRFRLEQFAGATSATPNREEVEQILGPNSTAADCEELRTRLGLKALLVTNGNQGMTLHQDGQPYRDVPAVGSLTAVDVTGAGDTVIAAYGLGLASGLGFSDAADIANHAGGIVVMKKQTAVASPAELVASVKGNSPASATRTT